MEASRSITLLSSSPSQSSSSSFLSPKLPFHFRNTTPLRNPTFHFSSSKPLRNYRLTPPAFLSSRNGSGRFFARASSSSSSGKQVETVGVDPIQPASLPPSTIGSPLFWVGVGVGISALFSWAASRTKKYAMEQAMKTMMSQMNAQNSQFNNTPFSAGSPFPFPPPPVSKPTAPPTNPTPTASVPATSASSAASQPATSATVDVPATEVEAALTADSKKDETEIKSERKKNAFVDVSPEETILNSPYKSVEDVPETSTPKTTQFDQNGSQNGAASWQGSGASYQAPPDTEKTDSVLPVEALEKMMEDPVVQKMIYPHLPEGMRNPETFKWMLQNPQYRQQLQDMLNNMSGGQHWNNQMMESLKNFDLNSPDVKQQFDQIGLTPEEVISRIMSNPEVAMSFSNPRVQQAIMECSQNPYNIAKYQNDKEVMDVFNKISELFPGAGSI